MRHMNGGIASQKTLKYDSANLSSRGSFVTVKSTRNASSSSSRPMLVSSCPFSSHAISNSTPLPPLPRRTVQMIKTRLHHHPLPPRPNQALLPLRPRPPSQTFRKTRQPGSRSFVKSCSMKPTRHWHAMTCSSHQLQSSARSATAAGEERRAIVMLVPLLAARQRAAQLPRVRVRQTLNGAAPCVSASNARAPTVLWPLIHRLVAVPSSTYASAAALAPFVLQETQRKRQRRRRKPRPVQAATSLRLSQSILTLTFTPALLVAALHPRVRSSRLRQRQPRPYRQPLHPPL